MSRFNNKPKNNQEFFDNAWQWLVVEDNPICKSNMQCLYRLEDKTCIIGSMIPDDIFDHSFEGKSLKSLLLRTAFIDENIKKLRSWFENVDISLATDIQNVHDKEYSDRKEILREIAIRYNLVVTSDLVLKA